jgi:hypothetical protein
MGATKPFTMAKQQVRGAFKAAKKSTVVLKVTKPVQGGFCKGLQNDSQGYVFTGSKAW